jgi:hypothetical protein
MNRISQALLFLFLALSALNPFSNLLYSFSRMPPLGFEPRCLELRA